MNEQSTPEAPVVILWHRDRRTGRLRAVCPQCRAIRNVSQGGTLPAHKRYLNARGWHERPACPGAGLPAALPNDVALAPGEYHYTGPPVQRADPCVACGDLDCVHCFADDRTMYGHACTCRTAGHRTAREETNGG